MKKWAFILAFGIWGCNDSEDKFGAPDQILLLSDREVICPGQTANLRLFSASRKQEIPISEFTFDPLQSELGSISPNGLYTAPSSFSTSQVEVTGTFRSKTKLSLSLKLSNVPNSSQGDVEISPFDFFDADEGRPFFFWPDGSLVLGTQRHFSQPLKKFEVTKYSSQGGLQWKKELGSGEAKFIEVLEDKIYVAGNLTENGAVFFLIKILDLDGNLVWEKKIPATSRQVFSGFQVDNLGNFYISTYTDGNSFVTSFGKFNPSGENIWEKDPKRSYREIYIFPDGNLVVSGDSIGYLSTIPLFSFYDQNGNLLKTIRADSFEVSFKGPDDTFGRATQISNPNNETASQYVDLYNSQGEKVVFQKKIGQDSPYSGQLDNPAQKKIAPAGYNQAYTDSSGEIYFLSLGFWGKYDFLVLDSSSGNRWIWWAENSSRTFEGVIKPIYLTEDDGKLLVFAYKEGRLYKFSLGKDYAFDDCLREPYWNKLEML